MSSDRAALFNARALRSRLAKVLALLNFVWEEFAGAKNKGRADFLAGSQIGPCKWWSLIRLGHGHALAMSQECTGEGSSVV